LFSIQKNWQEITAILLDKGETQRLNNININLIGSITTILAHFEKASKALEAEKNATIHIVLMHIFLLRKKSQIILSDCDLIKFFKERLLLHIEQVIMANLSIVHKLGLFLFPPANELKQFSNTEKNLVYGECIREMNIFANSNEVLNVDGDGFYELTHSELYEGFFNQPSSCSASDVASQELEKYKNVKVNFSEDFNILQWWESHKEEFPILFKVSCKILSTPASSASSERTFSKARNLISEKRVRLCSNDIALNHIMFVHSNLDNEHLNLLNIVT